MPVACKTSSLFGDFPASCGKVAAMVSQRVSPPPPTLRGNRSASHPRCMGAKTLTIALPAIRRSTVMPMETAAVMATAAHRAARCADATMDRFIAVDRNAGGGGWWSLSFGGGRRSLAKPCTCWQTSADDGTAGWLLRSSPPLGTSASYGRGGYREDVHGKNHHREGILDAK